jgi:hypothetical protein
MTTIEKKEIIKTLVSDMLEESYHAMIKKIDRALNSGAIDIDSWDKDKFPMITPKIIVTAILKNESSNYEGKGTSFEKQIRKEVKNLLHII